MSTATPTRAELAQLSDRDKRALLAKLLQDARRKPVLSVTQERLWQLDQIMPGNPVYNFQSAIALTGPLDLDTLNGAVARIVARHDTLRTRYGALQGKPDLAILPSLQLNLDTHDWTDRSALQQDTDLQRLATDSAQAGFQLAQPPLLRLHCLRMQAQRHVLVLTMHHIVSDLLSLDLFFEELGQHYGALGEGRAPSVLALPWTYQDHARAEHANRVALKQGSAAAFWQAHLRQAPDLSLHSDFPRPLKPSGRAATAHFDLEADTVKAVEALAIRERVTPFVVLLSAYYLLQSAASGQSDQLVGVPGAGRGRHELQGLIGMFSSPLPMRVDMKDLNDLGALLQAVKRTALGVTEHAALPFADIVEQAQAGSKGKAPALRTMFSFVSRMRPLDFPGLHIERIPTDRGMSDFDLFLTIYQNGAGWRGVFEYSTDLFGSGTARDWAGAYAAIVKAIANHMQPAQAPLAEFTALVPLPRPLRIAVSATFTADSLEEIGGFWQSQLHWPVEMVFAPYNQVFQTLMDPGSPFRQDGNALNVLLVRPEDWVRYQEGSALRRETLLTVTDEFTHAVQQARLRAPLLICLCPHGLDTPDTDAILDAERRIASSLAGCAGVTVLCADTALAPYQLGPVHDMQANDIGHIPFTRHWFVALGTELVRRASSLKRPPPKVIALDCDNTLWRGVCGEEGPQGVRVDAPFLALQEFMLKQASEGMLLCLVSKNEQADVDRVFAENADMRLTPAHIVGQRVNWLPKSANLRSLAAELKLGLDSFVFLDDNPVECAEVQAACPEVLTLCLPTDLAVLPTFLRNIWAFDRHQVSEEDRQRADSYHQNRQRDALRQQQGSFQDFLSKLELKVDIVPADERNHARLSQLTQRTNQFNNTGVRHDEAGLTHAIDAGLTMLAVSVNDRYGDYGLVGALGYVLREDTLRIDNFMLSCRVLGRGVEHDMMRRLGNLALSLGLAHIEIAFTTLPRNQPFRRFLASLNGAFSPEGSSYVLSATQAAQVRFDPDQPTHDAAEDTVAPGPAGQNASDVHVARQAALARIASQFSSLDDIVAQLDLNGRRRPGNTAGAPVQGETETAIAEVWQAVLRIDALGRDDNFFEVGGNSLLLVQVNSRLIERFKRDIQITTLFQFPTIASLARHLSNGGNVAAQRAQVQARGEQARQQLQQRMQRLGGMRTRH